MNTLSSILFYNSISYRHVHSMLTRIACYGSLFNNYYYNRQQHCSTTWNLTLLKIRSILIDCVKQIQRKMEIPLLFSNRVIFMKNYSSCFIRRTHICRVMNAMNAFLEFHRRRKIEKRNCKNFREIKKKTKRKFARKSNRRVD